MRTNSVVFAIELCALKVIVDSNRKCQSYCYHLKYIGLYSPFKNSYNQSVNMSRSNICCPQHPDAALIEDHRAGDMICSVCGLVVGDRVVDVGSEWRTFSDSNSDPSRVGAAENPLLDNDLSTTIGRSTGTTEYHNRSSMSSTNRTLLGAYRDINEIADRVGLPRTITDEAASFFRRVHEQRKLRNRPRLAIASACIYIACRIHGAARSFKELSSISGVQSGIIAKCYKNILKIETTRQELSIHVDSGDFISRFCSNLSLPLDVQRVAIQIAASAKEKSITDGRNPTSIAAAAIYLASQASDSKRSQKEISEVAGCAESTIKHSYRLMLNRVTELIPPESPFHARIDQLPPS